MRHEKCRLANLNFKIWRYKHFYHILAGHTNYTLCNFKPTFHTSLIKNLSEKSPWMTHKNSICFVGDKVDRFLCMNRQHIGNALMLHLKARLFYWKFSWTKVKSKKTDEYSKYFSNFPASTSLCKNLIFHYYLPRVK